MALLKDIEQEDGVITSYHRILYIQSMLNSHDSIAVVSYINRDGRERENSEKEPYKAAVTYEKPYQENMTKHTLTSRPFPSLKERKTCEGANI